MTLLYKETAQKVDLEAIDKLCILFNCQVGELFEQSLQQNQLSDNSGSLTYLKKRMINDSTITAQDLSYCPC